MTLQEALQYGTKVLEEQGIEDASLDAWLLLEFVTGIQRGMYLLRKNEPITEVDWCSYQDKITIRRNHIPLQHITGEQEFMGLPFYVNEDVLIPRQDTEVLVEEVLKLCRPDWKVLDVCTGSGCIAISLKKLAKEITMHALDISEPALLVAKRNAVRNQVDIQWMKSNLLEKIEGNYDLIVSNPPYIKSSVIPELMIEVKEHEPILALDGKEDGLYFYREIIKNSKSHLKGGGFLCFEIGYDQGKEVSQLMEAEGFYEVTTIPDLTGLDRVVIGKATEQ